MSQEHADGIANSVDPDQTWAVWSGSTLYAQNWSGSTPFAQTYLSENLGSLR